MQGNVRASAGLLLRHWRLAACIFVVNLMLAALGSLPARMTLSSILDHSLASFRLVSGFDLGLLVLLLQRPDVNLGAIAAAAAATPLVFLVYLLFLDGGIFAVYLEDSKLSRAEFFQSCGLYFWRMVRLALYSLVPFGIVGALNGAVARLAGELSSESPVEKMGFYLSTGGRIVALLLMLGIRLCFDLAQARVVHGNERRLLRTVLRSFPAVFASGLYLRYLGIALGGALTCALGAMLWLRLPHGAVFANLLLMEFMILTQIVIRLWLKAASARWVALNEAGEIPLASVPSPFSATPEPRATAESGSESDSTPLPEASSSEAPITDQPDASASE